MADSGRYRSPQGTDQAPTPERDERGRFAPGHPRLGGRRKGTTLSAELRRQGNPEAIAAALLQMIADPKTNARERLQAIQLFGDRTEGKPLARSLQMRLGANSILPAHFFVLAPADRAKVLDEIRQRVLAGQDAALLLTGDTDE